jgi:hypothetical protein
MELFYATMQKKGRPSRLRRNHCGPQSLLKRRGLHLFALQLLIVHRFLNIGYNAKSKAIILKPSLEPVLWKGYYFYWNQNGINFQKNIKQKFAAALYSSAQVFI